MANTALPNSVKFLSFFGDVHSIYHRSVICPISWADKSINSFLVCTDQMLKMILLCVAYPLLFPFSLLIYILCITSFMFLFSMPLSTINCTILLIVLIYQYFSASEKFPWKCILSHMPIDAHKLSMFISVSAAKCHVCVCGSMPVSEYISSKF